MKTRSADPIPFPSANQAATTGVEACPAECFALQTTRVGRAADVCILILFGALAAKFIGRFIRNHPRRWSSLALIGLAAGWVIVPAWDLGLFRPHPYGVVRWLGAAIFVAVLWTTTRAERTEQPVSRH